MVTIKDGCGCDPCDCDWKQKLKEAYSRAIQSVNKIGDETGRVYYPDGTGFVKVPLPTKEQIDSLAEIDGIKASVDELNKTVPALETQVIGVTESLVSDVEVLNGTTAGKFKVRIGREKAALIDSNDYDLSKVNSIELIQGSGPAMVKAQLTLSDGTVLRSDDFLFTTESIGTDVYISSFTFKAGNVDGTISADIGLNNGTTLEANNFVVPTDPSVVSTITDLQTRMSAVESGNGVSGLDALKATVETHTTEIAQLTDNVGNLMTSKVNIAQGAENAGKMLGIGNDGNVAPIEIVSSGNNPPIAIINKDFRTTTNDVSTKVFGTCGIRLIRDGNGNTIGSFIGLEPTSTQIEYPIYGVSFADIGVTEAELIDCLKTLGVDKWENKNYYIVYRSVIGDVSSNVICCGNNGVMQITVNNGNITFRTTPDLSSVYGCGFLSNSAYRTVAIGLITAYEP